VIEDVATAAERGGADPSGVIASPIRGPAGNAEFLLHARVGAKVKPGAGPLDIDAAISAAEGAAAG
jgi:hypothetical protein